MRDKNEESNVVWHCPGCGYLLLDDLRVLSKADLSCRCRFYKVSDYVIGMPDVTMSDEEVRRFIGKGKK